MGMDVCGTKPSTPAGDYFRNNVWYWRPLWTFVVEHYASILPADPDLGFYNDGYALSKEEAFALGASLLTDIRSGAVAQYEQQFNQTKAEAPLEECALCNSTGIRTDDIGEQHGMPIHALNEAEQILYGRTHGWCNGCQGAGRRASFFSSYYFTVENVHEFAMFLMHSGGITIY